jgi:hypothetical protein
MHTHTHTHTNTKQKSRKERIHLNLFKQCDDNISNLVIHSKTPHFFHTLWPPIRFLRFSEQALIISLKSTNQLVFVMQKCWLLIRTNIWNAVYINFAVDMLPSKETIIQQSTMRSALVSQCWGLGSIPGQSMWNLLWSKWYYYTLLSEYFCFPLSLSVHQCSILIHSSITDTI